MTKAKHAVSDAIIYQVTVKGLLNPDWCDWLEGIKLSQQITDQGMELTSLVVVVPDQSALQGILSRLHLFNLELVLVKRLGIGNIEDLEK